MLLELDARPAPAKTSPPDINERKRQGWSQRRSAQLAQAILDLVPAYIAVLNRHGVVVVVNGHWQQLAQENPTGSANPARHISVGVNYLEQCRRHIGEAATAARLAHDGIQAVLQGRWPNFALDYRCDLPAEKRWFSMAVTPMNDVAGSVVIAHCNMTELKPDAEGPTRRTTFVETLHRAFIRA
jgi:PAS domain-containing protein